MLGAAIHLRKSGQVMNDDPIAYGHVRNKEMSRRCSVQGTERRLEGRAVCQGQK
jgi:hypothetical protein